MDATPQYSSFTGSPYQLSKRFAPAGHELWIASRTMTGEVPRLEALADGVDERIGAFVERANAALEWRSKQLGRDCSPVNFGWLPFINSVAAPVIEGAGVAVPGDPQRRMYGVLKHLVSGSASVRDPRFYGPVLPQIGTPQRQFFTGDALVDRSLEPHRHALRAAYPEVARLLNADSTYVELVKVQ
jgi:hypothetical protein